MGNIYKKTLFKILDPVLELNKKELMELREIANNYRQSATQNPGVEMAIYKLLIRTVNLCQFVDWIFSDELGKELEQNKTG